MATKDRNGNGPESAGPRGTKARRAMLDAHGAPNVDQTSADADQSAADTDQTLSDADQTASASDDKSSDVDQLASDRDQATADRNHAADTHRTAADDMAYDTSRGERETTTVERLVNRMHRADTAGDRDLTATDRDRIAEARDKAGRDRDARAADVARGSSGPQASLEAQLDEVRSQAAADRARAASDRERAAADRQNAARERARLEAELRSAHLDELTGAYRREMGRLALSNEIDRARRSDGRFVLAFVDVDRLKLVNDREGHAAGDRVLQIVVHEIRSRLRSFDPIIRYGGDEFVCGLGATDLQEAKRRFDEIGTAIETDAQIGISVGLAALAIDDTADELTERADAAMLRIKARRHSREPGQPSQ
jgi:diguanylate cyclase (GGDEF)-like protein